MNQALPKIEAVFKKLLPTAPFDYKFVDEDYALKFAAEDGSVNWPGSLLFWRVFISCLGLFGLVSFMAEQRTKEIVTHTHLITSVICCKFISLGYLKFYLWTK